MKWNKTINFTCERTTSLNKVCRQKVSEKQVSQVFSSKNVNDSINMNILVPVNAHLPWIPEVFSLSEVNYIDPLPKFIFPPIGHFRVSKTLTFKMRLGAQSFLWKWVLFEWEWKIISISMAEHLPSFWNRGPGELGNDLLCQFMNKLVTPCNPLQVKIRVQATAV